MHLDVNPPAAPVDTLLSPVVEHHWNITELEQVPQTYPVDDGQLQAGQGITPIFFDGVDFRGTPTRVFAWMGIPEAGTTAEGKGVPGVVLVHGGGGTAFHDWVKLWMDRGYAAIAMDTGGMIPSSAEGMGNIPRTRHAHTGATFGGVFSNAMAPTEEQWPYHAVAAIIRANSLLRAQDGVDAERVGVNGISWGGVMTLLAAGVDERFAFAVSVYGSGFLGDDSHWKYNELQQLPEQAASRWLQLWDPGETLRPFKMPVLFVNGTNDKHFRPQPWQKTIAKAQAGGAEVTRSLQVRMRHGHPPAGDPPEVRAFIDSISFEKPALPQITSELQVDANAKTAKASWVAPASNPVKSIQLVYTTDEGPWTERHWQTIPLRVSRRVSGNGQAQWDVEANIPAEATACYFNFHNADDHVVSSAHWQR